MPVGGSVGHPVAEHDHGSHDLTGSGVRNVIGFHHRRHRLQLQQLAELDERISIFISPGQDNPGVLFEFLVGVLFRHLDEVRLEAALRHLQFNLVPAFPRKPLADRFHGFRSHFQQQLLWNHGIVLVKLHQDRFHDFRGREGSCPLKHEAPVPHEFSVSHREHAGRLVIVVAGKTDDVPFLEFSGNHCLLS